MKKRLVFPKKLLLFILVILAVGGLAAWASIMCSSPAPKQGHIDQAQREGLWQKITFWDNGTTLPTPAALPRRPATPIVATATPKPTPPPTSTPIPTPTATPTPFPTPTPQPGVWTMKCYNNDGLRNPVAFIRKETTINYTWGTGSPDPAIAADNFSCQWDGIFSLTGEYIFSITSDEGGAVWFDNQLLINAWADHANEKVEVAVVIPEGFHTIRVVYRGKERQSSGSFSWRNSKISDTTTPTPFLPIQPVDTTPGVGILPTPAPTSTIMPTNWEKPPSPMLTMAISQGAGEMQFRVWYRRDIVPVLAPAGGIMIPPNAIGEPYIYYFPILQAMEWLRNAKIDVQEFPGHVLPTGGTWTIYQKMVPFQGVWAWWPPKAKDAKEPYPLIMFRVRQIQSEFQVERFAQPGPLFECPAGAKFFKSTHVSIPDTCVLPTKDATLKLLQKWNPFLQQLPDHIWWGIYDQIP